MSEKCVDRLSILDGVVVAVGWSDSDFTPTLIYQGSPIPAQVCTRYRRDDLQQKLGPGSDKCGFRIAAAFSNLEINNSDVSVLFDDGNPSRKSVVSPRETQTQIFNRFVELVTNKKNASLIEIGSRARSGNSYKHLFPNLTKYTGIDVTEGPNVDIVADAHTLSSTITEKYDFVYSVSVFEHLIMPWVAAYELNAVMKKGGIAYIQSHPSWPLHDEPWDFCRFSKEAWSGLFNELTGFRMIESGYGIEANIVPTGMNAGALQNIDRETTFLLSTCMIEKIADPVVDWSIDPSKVYDLQYAH